jgi:cupin 2 domain-containing protein
VTGGNLFAALSGASRDEVPAPSEEMVNALVDAPGLRIERIVSTGQVTPAGQWYDGARDEWVALLAGAARLRFEDEPRERTLAPGDWLRIPAHARHRVEWTDPARPTVWLAVHFDSPGRPSPSGERAG